MWFDDQYRDILLKGLGMKAQWKIGELKPCAEEVLLFLDEPILSALGTPAYMGISHPQVIEEFNAVIHAAQAAGARVGIHCCGNMDWGLLANTDLDIIAFDAYAYGEKVALYPDAINAFLQRGGTLAYGLIPTAEPAEILRENPESLVQRFQNLLATFAAKGIDQAGLTQQMLLTPACGMGPLSISQADRVLQLWEYGFQQDQRFTRKVQVIKTPQPKISSLQAFKEHQQEYQRQIQKIPLRIFICMTGCRALGAQEVARTFSEKLETLALTDRVVVIPTGCIGMCAQAPIVRIEPLGFLYGGVELGDVNEIIETTLLNHNPVERLAVKQEGQPEPRIQELNFYKKQDRRVLANCGLIDPTQIEHAMASGTYLSTVKALTTMKPEDVIEEVLSAGLRGRGDAGFPTGLKWKYCRQSPGSEKVLICNADEGNPGTSMDRALLEGDPHRIIEGMVIAAYAIGATKGFVYVRAEYPIAAALSRWSIFMRLA